MENSKMYLGPAWSARGRKLDMVARRGKIGRPVGEREKSDGGEESRADQGRSGSSDKTASRRLSQGQTYRLGNLGSLAQAFGNVRYN
jgi:hypothetical protein